eukprot:TRINITY_DN7710_c0_g1_i2.p1 TRINITY_DN7710_c0_g1~~TRINITY_DN7710_c0_g1_i2.p1  ORF type:complete len:236 (+),score=36.87 TRINITY_DN7710_c0_g1_i2:35-742(+)
MSVPVSTLVRYANPVTAEEHAAKPSKRGYNGGGGGAGPTGPKKRTAVPTADILQSVIPAREWEENGQKWVQLPSAAPATRLDAINLQEQLDSQLKARRARDSGVCPVRQELYSQAFDELIREVTVESPERGVLMLRVRDDLRQTIDSYRTMFESSISFGTRKSLQADQGKAELAERISELDARVGALERENQELQAQCEEVAKLEKEKGKEEKMKFDEEMKYLKNSNNQVCTPPQ